MITAHDMAVPATMPSVAYAPPAPHYALPAAVPFRERLLIVVLFITVLLSSVAFIEPSPHDLMMGVLAVACLIAGVRFHRTLVLPFMMLLLWNLAGMMSLFQVAGQERTIQYTATSVYLAIAAMLFAMLFSQNTMARLTTMRTAYVLTASIAALCGAAGYFRLFPGAEIFSPWGRALGAFKDPNVYGPFLILPILFLLEKMLTRRIALLDLVFAGILLFGLLLGFSRGSWFHFALSALVMIALSFLTAPTSRARMRIFGLSFAAVGAIAVFVVFLLSFSAIGDMFQERAQLIQRYDVGEGGRFRLQEIALAAVLDYPNGMGPFEFANIFGLQQHNVYLQALLVYGWAGGMAYFILLLSTLWVGFQTALTRTPWQSYSITAYGAFVGEVAEGFIIDTDHWRHFYLILGIIWGLAAATNIAKRQAANFLPATGQR